MNNESKEIKTKYKNHHATYSVKLGNNNNNYNNYTVTSKPNYKYTKVNNKKNKNIVLKTILVCVVIIFLVCTSISSLYNMAYNYLSKDRSFHILSTYENEDMADIVKEYGKKHNINVTFSYAEDLDAVNQLNENNHYDAVWASNSLWLYQVENSTLKNSKSISINPIVMAIKKSKAEELGLVGKDITNKELVNLISHNKIKYVMSSVIRTNSGASAYLGFLNSLAGSPEVLTSEMLQDKKLKTDMVNLFSGVERVSGTYTFLEDMFISSSEYEAVIAAETSLIRINQELVKMNKEPLYLIYPTDGVAISDSPFVYVDHKQEKEDYFETIQKYLLSEEMQEKLQSAGRRTWYGGVNEDADKNIFNPEWGIDTTKYLIPQKYPSKQVIKEATVLYIDEFRKPSHTVFLLDYSGSMQGNGISELRTAMNYVLNYELASNDYIQFSEKDRITIMPFNSGVINTFQTLNGRDTASMLFKINNSYPSGGTNIYLASIKALELLERESNDYTKTIILMTDGHSSDGYNSLSIAYNQYESHIPIYSITFGNASYNQLYEIANLTNAKVFDGKYNLKAAFKEVRSFN